MPLLKSHGLDGHFWVERDGVVVDPTPFTLAVGDLGFTGELVYVPADSLVQTVLIRAYMSNLVTEFNLKFGSSLGTIKTTDELWERNPNRTHKIRQCPQNASFEAWKNGGTIVFGSLGYKCEWGNEIYYEYGGEDYVVTDFLAKTTTKRDAATDKMMADFIRFSAMKGLTKQQILEKISSACAQ